MQTIHEVPGMFRIMLMREYSPSAGSNRVIVRKTPFCLTYREPDADSAQNQELNDELFAAFLTLDPAMARVINKHLPDDFKMPQGMLEELLKSPKSLLDYVVQDTADVAKH